MKKISLVFKIGLAFFLFGFALWYQQWWYNLTLAALLAGLIRWEKLRLFRFPRQGYFFAFFLLQGRLFRDHGLKDGEGRAD